jgi:hypothetical protein
VRLSLFRDVPTRYKGRKANNSITGCSYDLDPDAEPSDDGGCL